MRKKSLAIIGLLIGSILIGGCSRNTKDMVDIRKLVKEASIEESGEKLVIYSPHSLDFIKNLIAEYENKTKVQVDIVSGSTGDLLEEIKKESGDPKCDVFWGGAVTQLVAYSDYFDKYVSKNEGYILDDYKNINGITSFSVVPSVLIINTSLIKPQEVNGYKDLLKPELKGKIASCSPEASSSAYEHLVNALNAMGDGNPENGWGYIDKLIDNMDGVLFEKSSEVYSKVASGEYAVGLTYEEGAIRSIAEGAPVKCVYMEEGVICRADGCAVIKGAKHSKIAYEFVDFITNKDSQKMVGTIMNRRPVRGDVSLRADMLPYNKINILNDDADWASNNKASIVETFMKKWNSVNKK